MTGIWVNNEPKKTLDTVTGVEYPSRHQAGRAVSVEVGVDPQYKPSPWYPVLKKCPNRFKDVATGKFLDSQGNPAD